MSPTGDSPSVDSASKKGKSLNQSLMAYSIKQLHAAAQPTSEDSFRIDGREVNEVTIIGAILSVNEQTTNLTFVVDDGTGKIEVKIWLEEKNEAQQQKKASWRQGTYVRVIGNLRSLWNKRSIVAFTLIPIVNFNELTFHLLETIYTHLYNTRGPLTAPAPSGGISSTTTTSAYGTGGWGGGPASYGAAPHASASYGGQKYVGSRSHTGGSLNDLQRAVLTVFKGYGGDQGVSIGFVASRLSNDFNEYEVRQAVDFLSQEGHLYSTIDDEHFKSTD